MNAIKATERAGRLFLGRVSSAWGALWGYPRFDNLTDSYWQRSGAWNGAADLSNIRPEQNSVVSICLGWIADNLPEPRLEVVKRKDDGTWAEVTDHPLTLLLRRPNKLDDFDSLCAAWAMSYCVDGNAYYFKLMTHGGQVAGLQHIPPWMIEPASDDPFEEITHYVYRVDGREFRYDPEQIIHFRFGRDPENPRKGCSRLKMLLSEIAADNEATTYTTAILQNMGIVGGLLAITDKDAAAKITPAESDRVQAQFAEKYTGRGRGKLMIPTFPCSWSDVGRSPEELALDKIRQIPEARICAALRVPAMVAGLSVGDHQRTYSNYPEARKAAYGDCLIPLQRRKANALERFLLPDFDDSKGLRLRWCYDDVSVLQPDQDKLSERTREEFKYGGITLNEFREKIGEKRLPPEEGDVFSDGRRLGEPRRLGAGVPLSNGRGLPVGLG